jgi:tetratricopeptide (TPR) repeat protein
VKRVTLGMTGDAYCGLGRYQDGVAAYLRALPLLRDHFIRRHHGLCLLKLGRAYQAIGEHQSAVRYLRESLTFFRLTFFRELHLCQFEQRALNALALSPLPPEPDGPRS